MIWSSAARKSITRTGSAVFWIATAVIGDVNMCVCKMQHTQRFVSHSFFSQN